MLRIEEVYIMFEITSLLLMLSLILILEAKHTIHSLLGLMFIFICGAVSFINIGAEFIGLIFIIVYVGAVGIFFLFMIMLLNPNMPVNSKAGGISWIFIIAWVLILVQIKNMHYEIIENYDSNWIESIFLSNEINAISYILYDVRGLTLLVLGVLLFKAMIIAIDIARARV